MSANTSIEIHVNGEVVSVPIGASVTDLVQQLGLDVRSVAVELGGAVVPRSAHAHTRITPNSAIEIVQFIGGG